MRSSWGSLAALLLLLVALGLGGCRPLYVPLVPDDAPQPVARTRLAAASALSLAAGRPRLTVSFTEPAPEFAEGDWLAVQWYAPSGRVAASESRWLTSDDVDSELLFELPPDVEAIAGEWRAVVSVGSLVLRQFRVDVPAAAVDPEP